MDNSTIAIFISVAVFVASIAKDIFGGSTKLLNAFHVNKAATTKEISDLRLEFIGKIELRDNSTRQGFEAIIAKIETRDNNARVGFEAVTANMHIIKEALLEQRAQMAENYMRRDSYYKASEELKKDFKEKHDDLKQEMHQGFSDLKDQIGAVAQSIEAGRKSSTRSHA